MDPKLFLDIVEAQERGIDSEYKRAKETMLKLLTCIPLNTPRYLEACQFILDYDKEYQEHQGN